MTKKILVISETFRGGGLESQVAGQARVLASQGVDLVLATGSSADDVPDGIFVATITGVPMGSGVTFLELRETIARLVEFARSEGADAIHAHPFFSTLVGLFVAQQARLPLVLTLHGPLSVSGGLGPLPDLIFRSAALRCASGVLCVSPEVQLLCKAAGSNDTLLLPNGVALPTEDLVQAADDAPWMWAGRIDDAKLVGLLDLIDRAKSLGRTLHVFGDGPAIEALRSRVEVEPAASFVRLCGWRSDLPNVMADYSIVAGMGRVLLEAAARDKPCLLVGYDGVKGLLAEAQLKEAAFWNLSGRGLPTLDDPSLAADLEGLARHPERYRLRPWIAAHRDERALWASYLDYVNTLPALESPLVQALLDAVRLRGLVDAPVWADEELARLAEGLTGCPVIPESAARAQNQAAIASLHQEISHLQDEFAAIRDGLRAERDDVIQAAALFSQRLQVETMRAQEAEEHLEAARTSLAEAASDKERIEAQLEVASQALFEAHQKFQEERDQLEAALRTADDERAKLKDELESAAASATAYQSELSAATAQLSATQAALSSVQAALEASRMQLAAVDQRRNDLEYLVGALQRSTSWTITAPVRTAMTHLSRLISVTKFLYHQTRSSGLLATSRWVYKRVVHKIKVTKRSNNHEHWTAAEDKSVRILHPVTVLMLATLPFDDVGGGQRSAQITRVLLNAGFRVVYLHAFRKYDFEIGAQVDSDINLPRLEHRFLDNTEPGNLLSTLGENAVVIFQAPVDRFRPWLEEARNRSYRTVFEVIDAWDTSLGGDWFREEIYDEFVQKSDVVVGTARKLVDSLVEKGRADALYLPNAVNDSIFDHYRFWPRPSEYDPARPTLLYYGSLYGEWFGWNYIEEAALACPGTDIILIGDIPPGISMPSNVKLIGPRLIDQLPAYLQHCDAALLPFIPGKISDAVSPIKIFEYLAMGKPVIATRLPEIADYPNVSFAEDPGHFARLCQVPPAIRSSVDLFISENTWGQRAAELARLPGVSCISAIILMHNNERIIDRCLTTLKLHASKYLKEIIVVDNCSHDNGPAMVREKHPDVILIRNEKNGCSSGRNIGLSRSSGEFIAFFDSDQWFTSEFGFAEALSILQENHKIGAVGWAAGWFDLKADHLGGPIVDYLPKRGTDNHEYVMRGFRTDVHYIGTGGLFARRDILMRTGGFDERYDPTCFEDTDFAFRIKSLGYELAYRDLSGIRHQPHQTTGAGSGSAEYQALFKRNSETFRNSWYREINLLKPPPV